MNRSFIPPAVEYPLLWLFDLVYPSLAKLTLNLDEVEIFDYDKEKLRKLQYERVLFISNHPSTVEPPVSYYVANCMGSRFHFIASRAVFEWFGGFVGELIRRVGAFSILSGGLDRDAVKTARSILVSEGGKLAIYPEGMNSSNENDNLLPFQPGAVQIRFWGLEDALKKDSNADITIVTSFVKYVLTEPKEKLLKHIESSLKAIEDKLRIHPGERNLLRRFLHVGRVLLENAKQKYNLEPSAERMMEWLTRYETLLFGNSKFRPRKAVLKFAPFFSLKEYYEDYIKGKKATVEIVTNRVKNYMESMLLEAISFTQPIAEPLDTGPNLQV